jgi:hypothetical protein
MLVVWGQTNYVGGISTVLHGKAQGNLTTITFSEGELITSISGRARNMINQLILTTSLGKSYTIGGKYGGTSFSLRGPVYGFFGANAIFGGGYTLVALGYWTDASYLPPPPPPSPVLPTSGTMDQLSSPQSCVLQLLLLCLTAPRF